MIFPALGGGVGLHLKLNFCDIEVVYDVLLLYEANCKRNRLPLFFAKKVSTTQVSLQSPLHNALIINTALFEMNRQA